jgi:hypothetical protein
MLKPTSYVVCDVECWRIQNSHRRPAVYLALQIDAINNYPPVLYLELQIDTKNYR